MGKNILKMRPGKFKVDRVGFKANSKKKKSFVDLIKRKKKHCGKRMKSLGMKN